VIDMRTYWLGLLCVAAALPAAPAAAAFDPSSSFTAVESSASSVRVHRGDEGRRWRDGRHGDWRDGRHDRDGPRRGRGRDIYVQQYYGGEWARYNNRGWESDSYNDWWHDQPHRSMPRWVERNGDCQRQWWSGGGWTC
jgi:hypothetical protein